MDHSVIDAVWAVPIWDGSVSYWFTALCATVGRQSAELREVSWEWFATELRQQAAAAGFGPEVTSAFVDYLSAQLGNPLDVIQQVYALDVDQFVAVHQQAYPPVAEVGEGYDLEAWSAFLSREGARWSGEESGWQAFTEWFCCSAEQAGVAVPASQFVSYVESQGDKVATFAEYGVVVGGGHTPTERTPVDEALWRAYLSTNLARWDGSAESWDAFTEWFLFYAAEAGVTGPAQSFVRQADGLSGDDRIAMFARYGVHINGVVSHESAPGGQGEGLATRHPILARMAQNIPGFEQVSEDVLVRIVTEVVRELGVS